MILKPSLFILSVFVFISYTWAIDATCINHFKKNKIEPGFHGCLVKCATTRVSMSTFTCHKDCSEYCKDPCVSILERLNKKIAKEKIANWPLKESQTTWSQKEMLLVTESLSRLPEALVEKFDFGLYRMSQSASYPNPATNSTSSASTIVIYDTAFSDKYVLDEVLFHEIAHLFFRQLSADLKDSYYLKMNWLSVDQAKSRWISRKDGFIKDDGRISPEEDFSNNFESYLFYPEKLRSVTPNAFDWIKENFGNISLQKGCRYAK